MAYANQKGQTLVALLFFVLMGVIITAASAIILSTNALAASRLTQGEIARQLTESGAETALLSLLRDRNYTGETLVMEDATILIDVTGTTEKIIAVTVTQGDFIRKLEVDVSYDGVMVPGEWREIN